LADAISNVVGDHATEHRIRYAYRGYLLSRGNMTPVIDLDMAEVCELSRASSIRGN